VGCYIWYSEEGTAATPPSPLLAVPNVTAHPSTVSLPITVLLYDGPLLCGFNVAIKGLSPRLQKWGLYATMLSIFVCSFVRLSPFHLLHLGVCFFSNGSSVCVHPPPVICFLMQMGACRINSDTFVRLSFW